MSGALANRARADLADASDAILGETLSALRAGLGPDASATVERVEIGLFLTGVRLSNGHGGVCFTPVKALPEAVCCPSSARAMPTSGKLRGASASRLADEALSDSPIRRAVGIATLNALSNARWAREPPSGHTIRQGVDPLDALELEDEAQGLWPLPRRLPLSGSVPPVVGCADPMPASPVRPSRSPARRSPVASRPWTPTSPP